MQTITGYVYDDAADPAEGRQVRLYRRDTGVLLASGTTGPSPAVIGDTSYASVAALLPMNGVSGSTTFTDLKGGVWTPAGGAEISTAHAFFGTGVGFFDGDARITLPGASAPNLTNVDYSIEFLVRITSADVNHVIVNKGTGTGNFAYQVWIASSNMFGFRAASSSGGSLDLNILGGTATPGVDYFISARRVGDVFTLHVNDSLIGSQTISGPRFSDGGPICVGAYGDGVAGLRGYIGQLRITSGVARSTAVPTAPWPTAAISAPELLSGQYSLSADYVGETQRIVLDDAAGALYNDKVDRVMLG